ncbi:MAG: hypothetical protein CME06_07290 [Gemmatimonadetes bacterium]|nr:hypothetical protein [Gemmatimonadota bacterium]
MTSFLLRAAIVIISTGLLAAEAAPQAFDRAQLSQLGAMDQLPSANRAPHPTRALEGVVEGENYALGPGDELEIIVHGRVQLRQSEWVGSQGDIAVLPAGVVHAAGRTLTNVAAEIRALLSPLYPGSEVHVQLRNVRSFQVRVLGEVEHPGVYLATPMTRVSDIVQVAAAGARFPVEQAPEEVPSVGSGRRSGALRSVRLIRAGEETRTLDVLGAIRGWPTTIDPFLFDGDRIIVPPLASRVIVAGEVHVPGEHEVLPGEHLDDLLRLAGGIKPDAANQVLLRRSSGGGIRLIVSLASAAEAEILAGDRVYVPTNRELTHPPQVRIQGAVRRPGPYPLVAGDTVFNVLELAGGWLDEALPTRAYLVRGGQKFHRDAQQQRVLSIPDSLRTHDEWEYLIQASSRADGTAYLDLTDLEGPSNNPVLSADDVIVVPSRDDLVYVSGAVMRPGGLVWREGGDLDYYLGRAGGPTERADLRHSRLVLGSSGGWIELESGTTIGPGDTVWIPGKRRRDYWALLQESLSFVGQLATVYLVVTNI